MDAVSDKDLAALGEASKIKPLLEVEFEAFMYVLRQGSTALSSKLVKLHSERLTAEQLQTAVARLMRVSASNAKPWTPAEIRALVRLVGGEL